MIKFKDEIIYNLTSEISRSRQLDATRCNVDPTNLLDLPEEVFGVIFRYIPNDQVVWSVGFTCQLLMEYALRFVWVIEDRISKPMIGQVENNLVDLTNEEWKNEERLNKFGCKVSQLISMETVAKTIYHFAYAEDYRYHEDIFRRIRMLNSGDKSKNVLLIKYVIGSLVWQIGVGKDIKYVRGSNQHLKNFFSSDI